MNSDRRHIREPQDGKTDAYNEERKGQDMVDRTPARPEQPAEAGKEQPPVVVQDLPD